ncbi:unnamed protein product [Brassicogethes aeneus]|uniref:TGF-beta family profile domain-containing protein n=1 Tax=Brassicogethes aeneus TaxID=1431903 RepID=A0A9P0BC31_BRAAE|nr:unnamed protein product [Brassicogethes aeneus]
MGSRNLLETITGWTLFLCFSVILLSYCRAEKDLIQDLGLNHFPDATKINISLEEYTSMMNVYLESRRNSFDHQHIPKLITFNLERQDWYKNKDSTVRLKFPISGTESEVEVETAQLRLLLPAQSDGRQAISVHLYQILGKRRRRFVDEQMLYLSSNQSKWSEIDLSATVKNWLDGERNLGVELVCTECESTIYPVEAAITALVYAEGTRSKRSYQSERTTDCRKSNGRERCCRHEMQVELKQLSKSFPAIKTIHMPEVYDAGFCQGLCPRNYNHATNHSRIQSLMHQIDRKKRSKDSNRKIIPKACCAPSKLKSLEILRVHPQKPDKLIVEKWDNMVVLECSCS